MVNSIRSSQKSIMQRIDRSKINKETLKLFKSNGSNEGKVERDRDRERETFWRKRRGRARRMCPSPPIRSPSAGAPPLASPPSSRSRCRSPSPPPSRSRSPPPLYSRHTLRLFRWGKKKRRRTRELTRRTRRRKWCAIRSEGAPPRSSYSPGGHDIADVIRDTARTSLSPLKCEERIRPFINSSTVRSRFPPASSASDWRDKRVPLDQ